jgi:tetratricopeptide (TPR) repeat protein
VKPFIVIFLAAVSATELWQRVTRETNSHAAAKRGVESYTKKQYAEAEKSFGVATTAAPSPAASFNLGTSQIAAGRRAEGSATLEKAINHTGLKPSALYNRGNSALASKSFEHAIRDYTDVLKLRPGDAQAKRNLEIALARQQAEKQSQGPSSLQQGQSPQQQKPPENEQQQPGNAPQQEGDADSLLRSVQQQEQEEMQRMKRARARSVRIGW